MIERLRGVSRALAGAGYQLILLRRRAAEQRRRRSSARRRCAAGSTGCCRSRSPPPTRRRAACWRPGADGAGRPRARVPADHHDRRRRGRPHGGRAPAGARPPADRLPGRRGGQPLRVRLQRRSGARASRRRWPPPGCRSSRSWSCAGRTAATPHATAAAALLALPIRGRRPSSRAPTSRRSACSRRRRRPASRCPRSCRSSGSTTWRPRGTPGSPRSRSRWRRAAPWAPSCCCARSPASASSARRMPLDLVVRGVHRPVGLGRARGVRGQPQRSVDRKRRRGQ